MTLSWLIGATCIVISTILWTIELWPQITRTLKRKTVDDISIWWLLICFTAFIFYEIGVGLHGQWLLFYTHIIPSSFTAFFIFLLFKYRKRAESNVSGKITQPIVKAMLELLHIRL